MKRPSRSLATAALAAVLVFAAATLATAGDGGVAHAFRQALLGAAGTGLEVSGGRLGLTTGGAPAQLAAITSAADGDLAIYGPAGWQALPRPSTAGHVLTWRPGTHGLGAGWEAGGGGTLAQVLALGADGNAVDQTNLGSLTLASGKTIAAENFSAWATTTLTSVGWTTNTTTTAYMRRVRDTAEFRVTFVVAGGAPDAAFLTFQLPTGLSVDETKLAQSGDVFAFFGSASVHDSGVRRYQGRMLYAYSSNTFSVSYDSVSGSTLTHADVGHTAPITFGDADSVQVNFSVPITGW